MKKLLFLFFMAFALVGQSQDVQVKEIFNGLSKSETSALNKYFESEIELCIGDEQDFVSKTDALRQITAFLSSSKPSYCKQLHQGSSKKGSAYRVAQLKTTKGDYRVFLYTDGTGDNFKVSGLVINQE